MGKVGLPGILQDFLKRKECVFKLIILCAGCCLAPQEGSSTGEAGVGQVTPGMVLRSHGGAGPLIWGLVWGLRLGHGDNRGGKTSLAPQPCHRALHAPKHCNLPQPRWAQIMPSAPTNMLGLLSFPCSYTAGLGSFPAIFVSLQMLQVQPPELVPAGRWLAVPGLQGLHLPCSTWAHWGAWKSDWGNFFFFVKLARAWLWSFRWIEGLQATALKKDAVIACCSSHRRRDKPW